MKKYIKLILMRIVYWIYLFQKIFRKKNNIDNIKKILVIQNQGIGDVVCLTPFLKELDKKNCEIWLCISDNLVKLQKEFFEAEGYINYNLKSFVRVIYQIRKEKFDLVLIPDWALVHSAIALFSKAKIILGFINDLSFKNRYHDKFILESVGYKLPQKKILNIAKCHISERGNLILKELNLEIIDSSEIRFNNSMEMEKSICLHVGADFIGRRWDLDKYIKLIKKIMKKYSHYEIKLLGGEKDYAFNKYILEKINSPKVVNLTKQLSLKQTYQLLKKTVLFIGNDSGPMHMAAFSGIKTIGIMGPNIPEISGPLGSNSIAVINKMKCSPCNQRNCRYNYKCIKSISLKQVWNRVDKILEVI